MRKRKMRISEQLGPWGVVCVIWQAIPWKYRFFTFPYGYIVYRRILSESFDMVDIRDMHIDYRERSMLFRLLRPRFHAIKRSLSAMQQ